MGLNDAGVPGRNLPAGEDHVMRRLADLERAYRELVAAPVTVPGGLLASVNGVVGDGVTDDTVAMQALLTRAAAIGASVGLAPMSVVMVDTLVIPSGTALNLNGATLKRTNTSGTNVVMLNITGVSNVLIWGGTIDGDKANYAATTEWRHGISILGSTGVTIRGVVSKNNKGDGIYVGLNGSTECADIVLDRVTCDINWRQGISIIAVDGLTATACRFTNTSGTAPMAGVNVEPNTGTTKCANIRFTGCISTGNAGNGFMVVLVPTRTATQGHITLTACTADGNTLEGVRVLESEDFQMVGGSASYNILSGLLHDRDLAKDTKLIGVTAKANGKHGLSISTVYTDWLIDGCTFDGNGTLQTADGLNIGPSTTSTNLRLLGNYSGGNNRYGVQLGGGVTQTVLIGNSYLGNGTADRNNAALADLDLDLVGGAQATRSQSVWATVSGFALSASYPHTAPLTVIKTVTITVPAGFTSANVSVISRVFAYNNNTAGGINTLGGDYLLAQTGIAGTLDFALLQVVDGSGSSGIITSPLATTLTGLTPGSTFTITIGANSDYLNWAAATGNVATVSGNILWFR